MMRLFFFLLGWAIAVQAQVNTERMRRNEAEQGWSNEVGLAMSIYGGNSRLLLLTGSYRMDWVGQRYYSFVVGNYLRGTSGSDVVLNKGFAHFRLQRTLTTKWKIEVFAQKEFNDFINLKDRQLAGGGLRLEWLGRDTQTVKHRPFDISIGSGLMVEHERFSELTKDDTRYVRSTNYLAVRLKRKPRTFLYTVGYFQTALEKSSAYRILLESTAGFSILENLAVSVSFNYRYDRRPASGIKKYDYSLSNGLTLAF